MKPRILSVLLVVLAVTLQAETVPDRKGAILNDRALLENDERWLYNDYERGFELGKWTKKPVLVVLRCVPCLACAGIDAQVLQSPELAPLLDQFVCVRLINANNIDLSLFQFDYDLSFSALFFNPDGTVYGRYGSWKHQKDPNDKTIAGFKRAMEGALEVHEKYPSNKESLRGKQGISLPFKSPLEIPDLAGRYKPTLDWEDKVVQSCVHCHQVSDALRTFYREQKNQNIPTRWIYPFPGPETIGLSLAPDRIAHVESVQEGSPAAVGGVQEGDEIRMLDGQRLISIADVHWALHRFPEKGVLSAVVQRGNQERTLALRLGPGWRGKSNISRRVGTWAMRAMAAGGLLLKDLENEERRARGVDPDSLALLVKHVGQYGKHGAAKRAGFEKGDVIVEVDGTSDRMTESELIGRLLEKYEPGAHVEAVVLREGKKKELKLPMQ